MPINQGLHFCSCSTESIKSWYCYRCKTLIRDPTEGIVIPTDDFPVFHALFRPVVASVIPRPDTSESAALIDEVVHKAFGRIDTFEGRGSINGWLKTLARHHYLDVRRSEIQKSRRLLPLDANTLESIYWDDAIPGTLPSSSSAIEWLEQLLPKEHFDLLYLRYVEDHTIAEAATKVGMTSGQARYRLPIIRKVAKAILELQQWLDSNPTSESRRYRALEASMNPRTFGLLKSLYIDELTPREVMNLYGLDKQAFQDLRRQALDEAKAIDLRRPDTDLS